MPWTINSEIYPLWARSTGNACAAGVNWTFNILVSLTFLHLAQYFTYYGQFLGCRIEHSTLFVKEREGDKVGKLHHHLLSFKIPVNQMKHSCQGNLLPAINSSGACVTCIPLPRNKTSRELTANRYPEVQPTFFFFFFLHNPRLYLSSRFLLKQEGSDLSWKLAIDPSGVIVESP